MKQFIYYFLLSTLCGLLLGEQKSFADTDPPCHLPTSTDNKGFVHCGLLYGFVKPKTSVEELTLNVFNKKTGKHRQIRMKTPNRDFDQLVKAVKQQDMRRSIFGEDIRLKHPELANDRDIQIRLGPADGFKLSRGTVMYHDSDFKKRMAQVGDPIRGNQNCEYIRQTVAQLPDIKCSGKKVPVKMCFGRARCGITYPLKIAKGIGGKGYETQTQYHVTTVACEVTERGKCPSATSCAGSSAVNLVTKHSKMGVYIPGKGYPVLPGGVKMPGLGYPAPQGGTIGYGYPVEGSGSVK